MIEETEDMADANHDYLFHIIESLKGNWFNCLFNNNIDNTLYFIE